MCDATAGWRPFMTMDNGAEPFATKASARSPLAARSASSTAIWTLVIPARYDGALPFEHAGAEVCIDCKLVSHGEHSSFEGGRWACIDHARYASWNSFSPSEPAPPATSVTRTGDLAMHGGRSATQPVHRLGSDRATQYSSSRWSLHRKAAAYWLTRLSRVMTECIYSPPTPAAPTALRLTHRCAASPRARGAAAAGSGPCSPSSSSLRSSSRDRRKAIPAAGRG